MTEANFAAILEKTVDQVEKPKPIAVGTYLTQLVGQPRQDVSSQKKTPFIEFTHKFISAGDDVDQDALKESLTAADGSVRSLSDVTMRNTQYLTENSLWRLKKFLEDCGFDMEQAEAKKVSLGQLIAESAGSMVRVFVKHEPSQDGKSIFARIDDTLPAE